MNKNGIKKWLQPAGMAVLLASASAGPAASIEPIVNETIQLNETTNVAWFDNNNNNNQKPKFLDSPGDKPSSLQDIDARLG